jgi:uncharacterized protein YceH (UPF0502 family)
MSQSEIADPPKTTWPVLTAEERRVLGVLVEKSKTTPDSYPMSLNALVAGCNQKSNREPIMDLEDIEVEDTLGRLQKKGLVVRVILSSSRVDKWKHLLYDAWHLDRVDLALLAELLLRGPQTEGELRTRASRMEPFADLDALRKALDPLAKRGLVVYLTPLGKRGTALTHGFHAADELDRLRKRHGEETEPEAISPSAAREAVVPAQWEQRLTEAHTEIARLGRELEGLRATVTEMGRTIETLTGQVREVRQGLGM